MTPFPFSETEAHPGDPLPAHLERVGERAANNLSSCSDEVCLMARISGLFHDIGKSTRFFQDYMLRTKRRTSLTPHSPVGAVLSWYFSKSLDVSDGMRKRIQLGTFLSVLRHHGRLREPWHDELSRLQLNARTPQSILYQQLHAIDLEGVSIWLEKISHRLSIPITSMPPRFTADQILTEFTDVSPLRLQKIYKELQQAVRFIGAFGSLLSVDKIDAALDGKEITRRYLPVDCVVRHKEKQFGAPVNAFDQRRQAIAEQVVSTLLEHSDQHLFTLTAPTGSGKTLTVLEAALALRNKLEEEGGQTARLIYCLPFTTVIDQNYGVFAKVLKDAGLPDSHDLLLKHHHLTEFFYRTSDNAEYEPDGCGELLTETWQSEIIVTTFYQVLHSVLSPLNRELKRAGQFANAIVLMDEVQAVPLKYWRGIRHLFQAMAKALQTRFILLTATRPLIFRPEDAIELLSNHEEHFKALSRTRLVCNHKKPLSLEAFLGKLFENKIGQEQATLIVVNRRKTVRTLYKALRNQFPDRPCFALSTDLTPKDRRCRIESIQQSLRDKEPCIVVSTQLVEAGVDISFPVVHRDLASLDAIIQTAGRCNRNNDDGLEGIVYLWCLLDDKERPQWQGVYDPALIESTCDVLGEKPEYREADYLDLAKDYFEICWGRADQDPIEEVLASGRFEELSSFKLIEESPPRRGFYITQNEEDQQLWDRYRNLEEIDNLRTREGEFKIFRRPFFDRVVQVYGRPDPDNPIEFLQAGEETYDPETGFIAIPKTPSMEII